MKNKNIIRTYLIVLIVFFTGTAVTYAFFNRDRIASNLNIPKTNVDVRNETNKGDSSSSDEKRPGEVNPPEPIFSSPHVVSNPGLRIISSYREFDELAQREDEHTFFVMGRKGCHYCELYQPVLKEVAALYKIEIVYVDMAALSSDDYNKVLHAPLKIPAKCSKTGEETDLSYGFGTPLTLFVNNYTTYDCIRGYKDKTNLIASLKEVGYID